MVGTAAACVGRSESIMSASGPGWRKRSGISMFTPVMKVACGRPQALTWNIGTTGSVVSRSVRPIDCGHVDLHAVQVHRAVASRRRPWGRRWSRRCSTWPRPGVRPARASRRRSGAPVEQRLVVVHGRDGSPPARRCRPGPTTTMCSTDSRLGSSGASSGSSEPLTRTTRSAAWLTIHTSWSVGSRRLSVCRTAPMEGTAKYASTCSALFHMRVATRSSRTTPSSSPSACASRAARAPVSPKLWRRGSPSPVHVVICDSAWTVEP